MKIIKLKKTDSTQEELKRMLLKGIKEDIFILAEEQEKGKGRGKKSFFSPKGGFYFSFSLEEKKIPDHKKAFLLSTVSAFLMTKKYLENYRSISPYIKIPNDIMVENKKIGGILIEKVKNRFICGIGINVNTEYFYPELSPIATSLFILTGKKTDINTLFNEYIEKVINLWAKENYILFKIYKENLKLNCKANFFYKKKLLKGKIIDINHEFFIKLLDENKNLRELYMFEISNFDIIENG